MTFLQFKKNRRNAEKRRVSDKSQGCAKAYERNGSHGNLSRTEPEQTGLATQNIPLSVEDVKSQRLDKLRKDWKPGKERDDGKKIHPYLIPWNELKDEKIKDYNREEVKRIPAILARAGFRIVG
ncbi:MAG: hypothetical protein K8T10_14695 [Candidatus Eremiobacteraeota bacterium]|nr:hypothetical protein [Candidatus Eremiobacteraeota bacterium]